MITKEEKSVIKSLLRNTNNRVFWDTLQKIGQDRINRIKTRKPVMDTEWDLIKTSLSKEFEIKGIKDLFNEIENYVNE